MFTLRTLLVSTFFPLLASSACGGTPQTGSAGRAESSTVDPGAATDNSGDEVAFIHAEQGEDPASDPRIDPDTRRPNPALLQPGDAVFVQWNKTWYEAVVLRTSNTQVEIHYNGYSESWDEWVGPARLRLSRPPASSEE